MAISQVTSGTLTTLKHDLQYDEQRRLDRLSGDSLLLPIHSHLQIQSSQASRRRRRSDERSSNFKPGALELLPNTANMPRERYFSAKEESHRLGVKQRKPFEGGAPTIDATKVHDLHGSSGFQGFVGGGSGGGLDLCSEQRLHEAALLDRKYEALCPDAGLNPADKFESSSVMPAWALYNGFAEQVFGHPNPHVVAPQVTLGYPRGDARSLQPTALSLPTQMTPELGGSRSLKAVDPLTLSRILLDQQVVAMAQMQQLRLLQQSYIASGNPLYLLPENLMPADLEVLWHLKHPGLPLPPAWTTLPWFQDESAAAAGMVGADLRSKDIRRYQDHLRYGKLEKPRTDAGLPLDGVDRTRFLRDGIEASEMARTAPDLMSASDCHSKEKKYRERKTFMDNEKDGFSAAERVKRDRRWWRMESKSGISEQQQQQQQHSIQQNWLEAGATEPSAQLQRNFVLPGYRQTDGKPDMGRNDGVCPSDYRRHDWPVGRAPSLNQERTRKPSENDTPDALRVGLARPSSDPRSRISDGLLLHPRSAGYAFSDRNEDFFAESQRVKDGQPPPPDWLSSMERAYHHGRNVGQFPVGGVYNGRTAVPAYRYSQEHVPTDLTHKSPTISSGEAMDNGEMNVLSSVKNSRHSFYPDGRHANGGGATNGAGLESRDGIGPEPGGVGFMSSQNGARDLLLQQNSQQQAALSRFSALEAQKLGVLDNRGDWEKTESSSRERFYHKMANGGVPFDFPGIPYSGSTGAALGRYSTYLDGHSTTSSVGVPVPSPSSNPHYVYSHHALASRLQMPSLSPITSCGAEVLRIRRSYRWKDGFYSKNSKKLKLDLVPRTAADSPLPSWMNKSTFSALSTNACIDSFKSFVDHTVQNAFMNEMEEVEETTNSASKATIDKDKVLEESSTGVGCSSSPRNSPPDIPVADDPIILTSSSMDSLASHPLSSAEMSTPLLAVDGVPCRRQETPLSAAGSDSGLPPLQLGGESGAHTKFKKTWMLSYLDQDKKLGSDSDVEMFSAKDGDEHQCKGGGGRDDDNEKLPVNGNGCATDSVDVELIDLSPVKKTNQA